MGDTVFANNPFDDGGPGGMGGPMGGPGMMGPGGPMGPGGRMMGPGGPMGPNGPMGMGPGGPNGDGSKWTNDGTRRTNGTQWTYGYGWTYGAWWTHGTRRTYGAQWPNGNGAKWADGRTNGAKRSQLWTQWTWIWPQWSHVYGTHGRANDINVGRYAHDGQWSHASLFIWDEHEHRSWKSPRFKPRQWTRHTNTCPDGPEQSSGPGADGSQLPPGDGRSKPWDAWRTKSRTSKHGRSQSKPSWHGGAESGPPYEPPKSRSPWNGRTEPPFNVFREDLPTGPADGVQPSKPQRPSNLSLRHLPQGGSRQ